MAKPKRQPPRTKRRSQKAGLPPGTPVYTGDAPHAPLRVTALDYSADRIEVIDCRHPVQCAMFRATESPTWVNVEGLHETEFIRELGNVFGLHPLTYEDVLNVAQRPKCEDFGEYLFIVLEALGYDDNNGGVTTRQISLVLGKNFLLTFQEQQSDLFKTVLDALHAAKGRVRKEGVDYLAYRLIDVVVDNYFVVIDKLTTRIELLEEIVLAQPTQESLHEIHDLKRTLIAVRRAVWPVREVLVALSRGDNALIQPTTQVFYRDVYDHTVSIVEVLESNRDLLSGLHDLYLSSNSNRLNEVMKVLTVIATIFMPMTFIASIYGMNFHFMPELAWRWGYWCALMVMAVVGVGMWFYFKRKRWV